jgi:biotin synthase
MNSDPTSTTLARARQLYQLPLFELIFQAHQLHREHHADENIQRCTLLSIKTGGCPENCSYCPQSAHHPGQGTKKHALLDLKQVQEAAQAARESGAERFCMGAAWREVKDGPEFDRVIEMVRAVKKEGLEACATLGMLTLSQAERLKEAGLDAYNHNLDSSREFYPEIIGTRTYDDRLRTLQAARKAGIGLCCGGILGMGESEEDRLGLLTELASMDPPPESVPINLLIPVPGTPLEEQSPVDPMDLVRLIAVARILMPHSRVRLSAGRKGLSRETQLWAFFAGANSIFLGDKLLTRENPSLDEDEELLAALAPKILGPVMPLTGASRPESVSASLS